MGWHTFHGANIKFHYDPHQDLVRVPIQFGSKVPYRSGGHDCGALELSLGDVLAFAKEAEVTVKFFREQEALRKIPVTVSLETGVAMMTALGRCHSEAASFGLSVNPKFDYLTRKATFTITEAQSILDTLQHNLEDAAHDELRQAIETQGKIIPEIKEKGL